jgi:SAM-dependent methyltransferase
MEMGGRQQTGRSLHPPRIAVRIARLHASNQTKKLQSPTIGQSDRDSATAPGLIHLRSDLLTRFRDACCPRCGKTLEWGEQQGKCTDPACAASYPIVGGIPILIDEAQSLFRVADLVKALASPPPRRAPTWKHRIRKLLPTVSRNVGAAGNYRFLRNQLESRGSARVLVLGGGDLGEGMRELLGTRRLELVESDVVPGPRAAMLFDAHRIPFAESSFDAVVVQAVLCYLQDPERCISEVHRVLRPDGLVYAETPFMQQVTGGDHDFVRFTELGHRHLFRGFRDLKRGAVCGPGMALAWAYKYFLLSLAPSTRWRGLIGAFADLTSFWLLYFDPWLVKRDCALDAASGVYFVGQKLTTPMEGGAVIAQYRGCVH